MINQKFRSLWFSPLAAYQISTNQHLIYYNVCLITVSTNKWFLFGVFVLFFLGGRITARIQ